MDQQRFNNTNNLRSDASVWNTIQNYKYQILVLIVVIVLIVLFMYYKDSNASFDSIKNSSKSGMESNSLGSKAGARTATPSTSGSAQPPPQPPAAASDD